MHDRPNGSRYRTRRCTTGLAVTILPSTQFSFSDKTNRITLKHKGGNKRAQNRFNAIP